MSTTFHLRDAQFPKELRELKKGPVKKKKVLIIAGPTSTGKTQLSLLIAKDRASEVISGDSMQVYRGTDIGTAKATIEERKAVVHHLIDICDIKEHFNVVNFYHEATLALHEILIKGKLPILVGGAGFYIHAFLYGPPKGPPSNHDLRARLESDYVKFGPEMLYEKLSQLDPDYAASITVQDRHKVIRALEIISITGKKVSEIPKPSEEDLARDLDFRCWFIYYPKPILYKRIEERCDRMIQNGLVEETMRLLESGLEENSSALNSIGYRQCIKYLQSKKTPEDWEEFVTSFKKASRNYAKRQFTWFRKEPLFRWLDLSRVSLEEAAEIILQDLEER